MTMKTYKGGVVLGLAMAMVSGSFAATTPIKNVLHFSKVGYYEHVGGIKGCTTAMDNLASQYHFTVKHSKDYNDIAVLATNPTAYDIIIFDNNTDAGGVNNTENAGQLALKDWLTNKGGRFLGFHAASDHRAQWAWYDTALFSGIQFTSHGDGQFSLYRDTSAATKGNVALQAMYKYAEDSLKLSTQVQSFTTEYYHFKDSKTSVNVDPRTRNGFTSFQELHGSQAVPAGNQSFGWIKPLPNKGRLIYTSLGHETAEWTDNGSWLTKMTWAYMKYLMGDFDAPAVSVVTPPQIQTEGHSLRVLDAGNRRVQIIDIQGRVVASGAGTNFEKTLPKAGVYFVKVDGDHGNAFSKAITIN